MEIIIPSFRRNAHAAGPGDRFADAAANFEANTGTTTMWPFLRSARAPS
jgi:hypothetical protein